MLGRLVAVAGLIAALGCQAALAQNASAEPHHDHASDPGIVPDLPGTGIGPAPTAPGFWLASTTGDVWGFGSASAYGSPGSAGLASPVVAITPTPDAGGYWLVASDGGVFAYGDVPFLGSPGATRLTSPIVGMAATHDGGGYWLVASDGGVFAYGDAPFLGSTGAIKLNRPIAGMAATTDGSGYWLFAADGGIFSFGSAAFFGSTGAIKLNQPIVSMASTPDDHGYWTLAADGGVFNFGDASFLGSSGSQPGAEPAAKIVAASGGGGYWIVDQNGTAGGFGGATSTTPPPVGLIFKPLTNGDKAVLFAFAQLGKPYIYGGNGPSGYDCSGLALASWQHGAGVGFARVAADQYHTAGVPVPISGLTAGDLVFWGKNAADWTSVYHAGMYVGGGQIVESTGDHVQLNTLDQWGASDIMPVGRRP